MFGVAAKGLYHVGHGRPKYVLRAVNSPGCHLGVHIDHPNSGWRQRVKGRAGRDEKGKHRPRLKESHGSLPILTASSHGFSATPLSRFQPGRRDRKTGLLTLARNAKSARSLPALVPAGDGLAVLVLDYGIDFHVLWDVAYGNGGQVWWVPNPYIRLQINPTAGRHRSDNTCSPSISNSVGKTSCETRP